MRCTRHNTYNCIHSVCRQERGRRNTVEDSTSSSLAAPTSAVHQAVYGGAYYGSTGDSSSSCDTSSSGSSYSDSGSSSSDSGSSSSSDCSSY